MVSTEVTLFELKACLHAEYIGDNKPFSWIRLFHRVFSANAHVIYLGGVSPNSFISLRTRFLKN